MKSPIVLLYYVFIPLKNPIKGVIVTRILDQDGEK